MITSTKLIGNESVKWGKFFFPGEKVPAFYRLFFRNILLYLSKFLMQFLTTRVARPLQSIRSGTY